MISIVIPTYNRGDLIKRSVESILKQSYQDIEIIVVDDNSSDDTADQIKEINSSKVKYYRLDKNRGACFARNYGVKKSSGEYIAFQDSDDIWDSSKLEKQLEYLISNNLDIVSCKIKIIGEEKETIFPENSHIDIDEIYTKNKLSTQTLVGKKQCFLDTPFDERLPRFQDWDLAINLVKKYNVGILDEVLVDVYMQDNSISKNPGKAEKALQIFLEKYGTNKRARAQYLRLIGVYRLQQHKDTKKYFLKSFTLNPLDIKLLVDIVLSVFDLEKLHYNIYLKKGRFK